MKQIEIIPTVVPDSLDHLSATVRRFSSFARAIHIDAGDGAFVQNKTWFPSPEDKLENADKILLEAHLMVEEPREEGLAYIRAGCKRVIAHVEAFSDMTETRSAIDVWKQHGAEVGLAVLLDTPLEVLEPMISKCDEVLVMSIATLGQQGAPYDPRAVDRIKELHSKYPELVLAVDGGVNETNIPDLVRAGATRLSIGSAISKSPDPAAAYENLLDIARGA